MAEISIAIGRATQDEIEAILEDVRKAEPEEILIVFMKSGDVQTRSNGTFSRMRTVGALEILKNDILNND